MILQLPAVNEDDQMGASVVKANKTLAAKTAPDSNATAATTSTTTTTTVVDASGDASRRGRSFSATSFSDVGGAAAAPAARRRSEGLINPWRELDSDAFVIAYATKSTARCSACMSKVAKGELQLGTFYMHEDKFTLVRWHHQRCVVAPECLRHCPMDLCGIEDLHGHDLNKVLKWLGFDVASVGVKDRSWTA